MRRRRREPPSLVLEDLPADVRSAVEAMVLGEEVAIVRGGRTIGALGFRASVLEGVVVPASGLKPSGLPAPEGVTVVATVVPLSEAARGRLSDYFGDDYVVLDVNAAPETADVVLTHPVSPQLIGMLQARFPRARVIVTEIDDDELGINHVGPVRRLMDAGASAYLPPGPVGELAASVHALLVTDGPAALPTPGAARPRLASPREP